MNFILAAFIILLIFAIVEAVFIYLLIRSSEYWKNEAKKRIT